VTKANPIASSASRDAIMRAAQGCFFEKGFARSSVDSIAALARVSKQTIYESFPSKTDLFEAVVRNAISGGRQNLGAIETDPADPAGTLNRFGQRLFERFIEPTNLGLFRANIVASRELPKLVSDLHELRLAAGEPVGRFIERLIANGTVEPCDALRAGVRLGGLVVEGSRYFLGASPPQGAARNALVVANVALFLDGYRAAGDHGQPGAREFPGPEVGQQAALRLPEVKLRSLLDAAASEFFQRGYVGASIDRIAAAAGVSKSTIHRQFVSKEGLFRHIVASKVHDISARSFEPAAKELEPAVTEVAAGMLDAHLKPDSIALHHVLIEDSGHFTDLARSLYDAQIAAAAAALEPIVAAHGWPRPGATALRAFHTLATFGVRFLTTTRLPGRKQRDELSAEAARIFLFGLAAPTAG
jgi:AcrR family transcriptional regulator